MNQQTHTYMRRAPRLHPNSITHTHHTSEDKTLTLVFLDVLPDLNGLLFLQPTALCAFSKQTHKQIGKSHVHVHEALFLLMVMTTAKIWNHMCDRLSSFLFPLLPPLSHFPMHHHRKKYLCPFFASQAHMSPRIYIYTLKIVLSLLSSSAPTLTLTLTQHIFTQVCLFVPG